MAAPMSRRSRRLATVAFVVALLAGWDLFRPAAPDEDAIVVAMSVQASDGEVLASPVVVGQAGRKVSVRLVCEGDPSQEKMRLTLDPIGLEDGRVRYSWELSVPGHVASAKGEVSLSPGTERKIALAPAAGERPVTLALYLAPLRHPGVERYLRERRARLSRAQS